ncbi:hypothetical protein COT72_02760 [archaeon CG10_big_fil_rev_8_21_14_0_10_43_11]|nr:MAG: hypothetical protein COT72_02760 [archaeon CG10_big_fil_rev_8_21_14_0_10_43_11]
MSVLTDTDRRVISGIIGSALFRPITSLEEMSALIHADKTWDYTYTFDYEEKDRKLVVSLFAKNYFLSDIKPLVSKATSAKNLVERYESECVQNHITRLGGVLDKKRQALLDAGMTYDFIPQPEANKLVMMRHDIKAHGFDNAQLLFEAYKTQFATYLHSELSECLGQLSAPLIEDGKIVLPSRFLFESVSCKGWMQNKQGYDVILEKAVLKKVG